MQFNDTFAKAQTQFASLNAKAVEFAEDNSKSAFAYARDVLAAKTPEAFWAVQQSFFKTQQDVVAKQTEAFGKFYADWAKETSAPMADALKPFLNKAA
jgi:hypothetical protein